MGNLIEIDQAFIGDEGLQGVGHLTGRLLIAPYDKDYLKAVFTRETKDDLWDKPPEMNAVGTTVLVKSGKRAGERWLLTEDSGWQQVGSIDMRNEARVGDLVRVVEIPKGISQYMGMEFVVRRVGSPHEDPRFVGLAYHDHDGGGLLCRVEVLKRKEEVEAEKAEAVEFVKARELLPAGRDENCPVGTFAFATSPEMCGYVWRMPRVGGPFVTMPDISAVEMLDGPNAGKRYRKSADGEWSEVDADGPRLIRQTDRWNGDTFAVPDKMTITNGQTFGITVNGTKVLPGESVTVGAGDMLSAKVQAALVSSEAQYRELYGRPSGGLFDSRPSVFSVPIAEHQPFASRYPAAVCAIVRDMLSAGGVAESEELYEQAKRMHERRVREEFASLRRSEDTAMSVRMINRGHVKQAEQKSDVVNTGTPAWPSQDSGVGWED